MTTPREDAIAALRDTLTTATQRSRRLGYRTVVIALDDLEALLAALVTLREDALAALLRDCQAWVPMADESKCGHRTPEWNVMAARLVAALGAEAETPDAHNIAAMEAWSALSDAERLAAHQDDSYGACVICLEWVPNTDNESFKVAFPCPTVRLASGHWVDLASPETAEALARAWGEVMDGRRIGSGLNAARINADTTTADDWTAILAAMRETGR